mmetsp:Transcript_17446/g.52680  ORF Transcript_17446/g.52680 Transcript_17446/m.52680 type:complete len:117 (-) Transcript_17446:46-396(-)
MSVLSMRQCRSTVYAARAKWRYEVTGKERTSLLDAMYRRQRFAENRPVYKMLKSKVERGALCRITSCVSSFGRGSTFAACRVGVVEECHLHGSSGVRGVFELTLERRSLFVGLCFL